MAVAAQPAFRLYKWSRRANPSLFGGDVETRVFMPRGKKIPPSRQKSAKGLPDNFSYAVIALNIEPATFKRPNPFPSFSGW